MLTACNCRRVDCFRPDVSCVPRLQTQRLKYSVSLSVFYNICRVHCKIAHYVLYYVLFYWYLLCSRKEKFYVIHSRTVSKDSVFGVLFLAWPQNNLKCISSGHLYRWARLHSVVLVGLRLNPAKPATVLFAEN